MNGALKSFPYLVMLLTLALAGCHRPPAHPYAKLDGAILQKLPDAELEDAILDYVESKIGNDYEHEYETVTRLPKGLQVIYATVVLEDEVNNGGYNQYFWNTNGKFRHEAADGFKQIGANEHAELTEEAAKIYEQNQERINKFKQQGTKEAFSDSYKDDPFSKCDDRFYKLKDDLAKKRVKFIREHPELFFGS
jgi:hypothetical protein